MQLPMLTALNTYELRATAADFTAAIAALSARVEREGERGVLSYRFFVNPAERLARAVVDYRDAAAWIGHHDRAMQWPEMAALHAVARLREVIFLGPVAPEIDAWLAGSSLTATILRGNEAAAAFHRYSAAA